MAVQKVFLEFEGMRQAGDIFVNGKEVGLYENGITAYGVDLSAAGLGVLHFGNEENVIAVKVDNRTTYPERATGTTFQWNANDFNPDHGGITRHVWLYTTGKIYQTLPLYYGLETSGVYVHAANYNSPGKSADVTVESEVKNASGDRATVGSMRRDRCARSSRASPSIWWMAKRPFSPPRGHSKTPVSGDRTTRISTMSTAF
jgi:beta-galactosidase